MTTAEYDEELNKAMDALSSLITRKQRGDGRNYATAYDYMQVYLDVSNPSQGLFPMDSISRISVLALLTADLSANLGAAAETGTGQEIGSAACGPCGWHQGEGIASQSIVLPTGMLMSHVDR